MADLRPRDHAEHATGTPATRAPLLERRRPQTYFFTRRGHCQGGGRRLVLARRGRDAGDRRRIRLRQEHDRALDHAAGSRSARPDRRRARSRSKAGTCCSSTKREMRDVRGNEISMIFQEPMTSLNPVLTIGEQIGEAVRLHRGLSQTRRGRRKRSRCCGW